MSEEFAKIFGSGVNQVLVKKDVGDDGNPELRFYFIPKEPEGLGVCSIAIGWKDDSETSWDSCDQLFDEITEEEIRGRIDRAFAKALQG